MTALGISPSLEDEPAKPGAGWKGTDAKRPLLERVSPGNIEQVPDVCLVFRELGFTRRTEKTLFQSYNFLPLAALAFTVDDIASRAFQD